MAEHFHALTVAEVVPETDEAVSIRFTVPPELTETYRFKPGQHVTLMGIVDGEEVRRNYSLCIAPADGALKVTVKRIAGGAFSNWANDNVKPGDKLAVMPPHGSFTVPFAPGNARRYVAIAGGSGITPILSLIRTALETEPASRFTLFYGNRDSRSIIFLEALAELKDRYMGRLELFHFLAEEAGDVPLFNGMLDAQRCAEAVDQLVPDTGAVDAWFICGPGPMMDAAESVLLERGIERGRIHIERFTAGRPSAGEAAAIARVQQQAAGQTIAVTLDGRTRQIAFDGGNILDSARKAGMPAPFACKAGVCATCRAKLVSGTVEMAANYGLTDEEVAEGYVLTCQSVPTSEGVTVDYDV
ncbi:1,2-phenylacetyl-CoA epoxidase subunit PaaE [Sphingomonas mesophila]|uniref:1,2-phenylacetyl-CoA epoxidase subunit PaaE n=1 Tax=Sphingomonas mesophila TaxID=2303576 RepID=UPI000E58C647|nr:1,2-phenylacetyl-CoA epoxidase subunit PaaE [Sphingomonas mesophila]